MIINRVDGQYYESSSDFPNYGSWKLLSIDGNIRTLGGDDDISRLPTNVPATTKALATDGTLYFFNGTNWEASK